MTKQFKASEVSKFFKVTRATVANWISAGKLTAYETIGGHYRIMREDLLKFIKQRKLPLPDELKTKEQIRSGKYRILIADDEKNIIESVKEILGDLGVGIKIETAQNGFEAGMKAMQFLPHLVILDAIMPGADGDVVVKLIKGNKSLDKMKIMVFTGYPAEGRKLLRLGADKVIEKSGPKSDPDSFRKEVRRLLDIKYVKVMAKT